MKVYYNLEIKRPIYLLFKYFDTLFVNFDFISDFSTYFEKKRCYTYTHYKILN